MFYRNPNDNSYYYHVHGFDADRHSIYTIHSIRNGNQVGADSVVPYNLHDWETNYPDFSNTPFNREGHHSFELSQHTVVMPWPVIAQPAPDQEVTTYNAFIRTMRGTIVIKSAMTLEKLEEQLVNTRPNNIIKKVKFKTRIPIQTLP